MQRAVFSPDGKRIFTWGRHAWLWDLDHRTNHPPDTEPLRAFGDRFGRIVDVVFTPDSSRFFIWNDERRAWRANTYDTWWLWDIEDDRAVVELKDHVPRPGRSDNVRFMEPIIVAEKPPLRNQADFDAWQADLKEKAALVRDLPHPAPVKAAVFSPDESLVLTWCHRSRVAGADEAVWLWDAHEKKQLQRIRHGRSIAGAAFDPEGRRILIFNADRRTSSVRVHHVDGYRIPLTVRSQSRFGGLDSRGRTGTRRGPSAITTEE